MAELDPRLGRVSEHDPIRPTQTLSGQERNKEAEYPIHGLGHGWYVYLDNFPPRDFDVNAELSVLREAIQPVSSDAVEKAVEKSKKAADAEGKA